MILPTEAHPLVQVLALNFTSPTYQRFSTLMVAALVTTGRRTVANVLRTLRHLAPGHRTDYQRTLVRASTRLRPDAVHTRLPAPHWSRDAGRR
ncbi:hypothetical protein VT84_20440 [Gemmata sp. SH-PL17]|uniref:hypothetical protein n=1 Tax=Gemmata sp. SH-PL17 TaxID=1630693 RepID=UPI00078C3375|nr:hypothetical protein [Gemmata sp. SH-PL17]AMV26780.1 hypothetical protein VT84_20440 [Gemmata sp. SH-PL17]